MIMYRFERLYFSDAYYVPDEQEPLMNTPHGYMTNDDVKYYYNKLKPYDNRNNTELPALELLYISLAFWVSLIVN
jgi:hypothetical protein